VTFPCTPIMPDTPAITVVTATRNRTDLLERALRSVAAQDYPDYEAIVADDGSDAEVQAFQDALVGELPRFRVHRIRPAGSAGATPGATRNAGLRLARGEFVAFLDDDDYWVRTDHLSVAADQLRRHGADFFFGNMQGVKGETVVKPDWFPDSPALTAGRRVGDAPAVFEVSAGSFWKVMRHHLAHPNVWVVRRDLLLELGGFWDKVRLGEDWELMMRVADRCRRILYRPDPVCAYRFPEGNSVSLTLTGVEEHIQTISCSLHARSKLVGAAARRCARSREAAHLRAIAKQALTDGRTDVALSFAWQAACTFPNPGGAVFLGRCAARAVRGR
jgi:hypothetical protein